MGSFLPKRLYRVTFTLPGDEVELVRVIEAVSEQGAALDVMEKWRGCNVISSERYEG